MSAFAALIEGLRDLFRDRWELEAAATAAIDALDLLCAQLDEPWVRCWSSSSGPARWRARRA